MVDSMGHLLLSTANNDVGFRHGALYAAAVPTRGSEETLALAADPTPSVDETLLVSTTDTPSAPPLSAQAQADSALVRRVQVGDIAAFEELFHKYNGVI